MFSILDENDRIWKHSVPLKKSKQMIYIPKYSHRQSFLETSFRNWLFGAPVQLTYNERPGVIMMLKRRSNILSMSSLFMIVVITIQKYLYQHILNCLHNLRSYFRFIPESSVWFICIVLVCVENRHIQALTAFNLLINNKWFWILLY